MDATQFACAEVTTDMTYRAYQVQARRQFEGHTDRELLPWSWISTTCGVQCLNPQHMLAHSPVSIAYPAGVCVYCGFPSSGKDHLLPRPWTGDARRSFVAVVPSCRDCNSRIGDCPDFSVIARRTRAHKSLAKARRHVIVAPDRTPEELAEFGPRLRQELSRLAALKQQVLAQLAWPEDPAYDLRAFQKSGIEDPYVLDLLTPMRGRE